MSRNAESTAFRSALEVIRAVEPRVADAIGAELADQRESLKLIASENYASPATLLAMGNWFSDKYAEGTVGRRFYAGCQNVDTVEALAAEHARELFGAAHAYVQPHSGIDANLVAFWAVLADRVESPALKKAQVRQVNDLTEADWFALRRELGNQRMLGMSLDAGGHLTHGFRPNISGKMFDQRSYGTDPATGLIDYDRVRRGRPRVQAADPGRRLLGVPPEGELPDHARDRRRGRRDLHGRHGALRRAGRRQGLHRRLRPGAARAHRHHHHAQVAARPARRHGAVPAGAGRPGGPGLPDGARRSAAARDGRQGGRARRGPPARLRRLRPADRRQRAGARRGAAAPGRDAGHRRHRQPPGADRRRPATGSPAGRPSRRCSTRASSPTATRSRRTRTAPGTRPASGSAPRR